MHLNLSSKALNQSHNYKNLCVFLSLKGHPNIIKVTHVISGQTYKVAAEVVFDTLAKALEVCWGRQSDEKLWQTKTPGLTS